MHGVTTEAALLKQLGDLRAARGVTEQEREDLMRRAQLLQSRSHERTIYGL